MTRTKAVRRLDRLRQASPVVRCAPGDRFVIFSDLHLGDGSARDGFIHNAGLFSSVLSGHYLPRQFKVVLNGDIEDLYRFSARSVLAHNAPLYQLLDLFHRRTALYKVLGNHDLDLHDHPPSLQRFPLHPALRLQFGEQEAFVLHGHQADVLTTHCHRFFSVLSRRVFSPLGIPNGSVAHSEMKKYRTEKRIYDFAKSRKLIAVIGHTHRPLFESLSRIDYLKFQIENLCRSYPGAPDGQKRALEKKAHTYQRELVHTLAKDRLNGSRSSLYDSGHLVPCVFNSGCATGKRGITAIEIANGRISLVFWFDSQRTTKYFNFNGYQPEPLHDTPYFRVPLKEDSLDYISTRIKLLA